MKNAKDFAITAYGKDIALLVVNYAIRQAARKLSACNVKDRSNLAWSIAASNKVIRRLAVVRLEQDKALIEELYNTIDVALVRDIEPKP